MMTAESMMSKRSVLRSTAVFILHLPGSMFSSQKTVRTSLQIQLAAPAIAQLKKILLREKPTINNKFILASCKNQAQNVAINTGSREVANRPFGHQVKQ